jgi:hypothetical protein
MASVRPWPFDDDRPSGSVRPLRQADLQTILAHLGDDPDQLLAGTSADRPVDPDPALAGGRHPRHRCWWGSPGPPGGAPARPGGCRARGHSGRLGATVPAQPRRHRLAARGGWGAAHRSAAQTPGATRVGGPARSGRPRQPGQPRPPGDRPGGVFVVDSKQYRGRLQLDPSGRLRHGRYPLTAALRAVSFEADRAAQVLADPQVVVPIMAVHGAHVPWGKVVTHGVPVVSARRLPSMLRTLPAVLGPERVAALAHQARIRFRAAA